MAKKTVYRSLMLKLLVMLIISAVAAIALYFLCNFLGRQIVDQVWLSPRRTESRITADIRSFRDFVEENDLGGEVIVDFEGVMNVNGVQKEISGKGNGPIDAFFSALESVGVTAYKFVSYSEHAISAGADSKAVSYIHLEKNGEALYGVGIDGNISLASIKGIVSAINRAERNK